MMTDHSPRQMAIIALLEQTGFATIAELAERFAVTTQTIRRDVNALCVGGSLARFHGGVGLPTSTLNTEYRDRRLSHPSAKDEIGRLVGQIIPDRASLFLNIGTTTEAVAHHLLPLKGLRVVTNNLHIAEMFAGRDEHELMIAGGQVRGADGGIVGEEAIEFLRGFRLDYGIIGISGIDPDGSLLDFDHREVRAAQAIIQNARKVILVADHTKFGRPAMAKAGHLSAVDILVTDQPVRGGFEQVVREAGVQLICPTGASHLAARRA